MTQTTTQSSPPFSAMVRNKPETVHTAKKSFMTMLTILIGLVLLLGASASAYFLADWSIQPVSPSSSAKLHVATTSGTVSVPQPTPTPVTTGSNGDGITKLGNLTSQMLRKDTKDVTLTPDFILTTSIISHDGNKIVYAEISKCIIATGSSENSCQWQLHVLIEDKIANKTTTIYSPSEQVIDSNPVLFPIAWSMNDKAVILSYGNPTIGGKVNGSNWQYATYTNNVGGIQFLAKPNSIFTSNMSAVVYLDDSSTSPASCGFTVGNNGEIVERQIETGQLQILLSEPDTQYTLQSISADNKTLSFTSIPVTQANGCSTPQETSTSAQRTISL